MESTTSALAGMACPSASRRVGLRMFWDPTLGAFVGRLAFWQSPRLFIQREASWMSPRATMLS